MILIAAGAFIAYNVAIVAYALATRKGGILTVMFISRYAPWLLVSKSVTNYLFEGAIVQ